jgi:hypothetical protein
MFLSVRHFTKKAKKASWMMAGTKFFGAVFDHSTCLLAREKAHKRTLFVL